MRAVVLPVPAGPTISTRSSWPATAAAASAWQRVEGPCRPERRVGVVTAAVDEATVGPAEQVGFLVEDGLGGERPIDRRLGDRSPVPAQQRTGRHGAGHVDTARHRHPRGHVVEPGHQPVGFDPAGGGDGGGQLADQLRRPPRRLPLRDGGHGPIDHRHRRDPIDPDTRRHVPDRGVHDLGRDQTQSGRSGRPTGDAAPGRRGPWVWPGGCPATASRSSRQRSRTVGSRPMVSAKRSSFSSTRRCTSPDRAENSTRTTSGTSTDLGDPMLGDLPPHPEPAGRARLAARRGTGPTGCVGRA